MTTINDIEQLFRDCYRPMFTLAVQLLHETDEARDVVHDVFATLLKSDAAAADVTAAYLMRAVRNACIDRLRRLSTRQRFCGLYALDLSEIDDEQWPDPDMLVGMQHIIDEQLTDRSRQVLQLRFYQDMTYGQIAETLQISEVAVYKHLRHALNVLRQNLVNYG